MIKRRIEVSLAKLRLASYWLITHQLSSSNIVFPLNYITALPFILWWISNWLFFSFSLQRNIFYILRQKKSRKRKEINFYHRMTCAHFLCADAPVSLTFFSHSSHLSWIFLSLQCQMRKQIFSFISFFCFNENFILMIGK
jgi:hypothetical protein